MKRKLYYTVSFETSVINAIVETNGWKNIILYSIENNEPKKIGNFDIPNEQNTKDSVLDYLNDNGYGDEDIELILL